MQGQNFFIPGKLVQLFEHANMLDISLAMFGSMVAAAVAGYLVRRVPGLLLPEDIGKDGQEAYVVSAVLGLLALLMGFTFSLALDRYEDRREFVLQEANAIGTAYLRAQLLPEPSRTELSDTLTSYTANRLELSRPHDERFEQLLATNDRLLIDLWAQTKQVPERAGATAITSLFVASVNEVVDLDATRKNARLAQVPSAVYAVLLVYMLIASAILGYSLLGFWARFAAVILFLLLNLSLVLILDIDRPLVGELREQQQPMEDLLAFLQTAPPERFDLPAAE